MSKGSNRRPQLVSDAELAENWERAFGQRTWVDTWRAALTAARDGDLVRVPPRLDFEEMTGKEIIDASPELRAESGAMSHDLLRGG